MNVWSSAQHGDCLVKKSGHHIQTLIATLIEPDPHDPDATVLELDELWSVVAKKTKKAWGWLAICRTTRQVVASVSGDRSAATCHRFWQAIPRACQRGICYSDFWDA